MGLQSLPTLTEAERKIAFSVAVALKANHTGQAKAISNSKMVKALAKVQVKTSDTVMRKIINYLRHEGKPICSGSSGYWWAANKNELAECLAALKDRVEAQIATLNQLKEIYQNY